MSEKNLTPISSLMNEGETKEEKDKAAKKEKFKDILLRKISVIPGYREHKTLFLIAVGVLLLGVFISVTILFKKDSTKKVLNPIVSENSGDTSIDSDISTGKDENVTTTDYPSFINGEYLSEENYNRIENKKPVSVMINNHPNARPPAGVSSAEVVYEIVAEGGVTRLLGIFHSELPAKVGPVRSMRKYFQQTAAEYFPISTHWGIAHRPDYEKNLSQQEFDELLAQGAAETDPRADARGYIDEISLPTLDQTALPADVANSLFYKDTDLSVATEHTAFIRLNRVYDEFTKVYPQPSWIEFQEFRQWDFKDEKDNSLSPVNSISYNFWDLPSFETTWKYNPEGNFYLRTQGDEVTKDRNTDEPVMVKNVVIQKVPETKLNDTKAHLMYDIIGSGDAVIYLDGGKIEATWSKSGDRERTVFRDLNGNPIQFNRGLFWITILPTYSEVVEE